MLRTITINNYRCYETHEIEFKKLSIAVGKNNAGKSTLVEVLRLVSIAANRFQSVNYNEPPRWTDLPKRARGISPSLKNIEFNTANLFNQYGEAPSIIIATFSNGAKITIYIGENAEVFCTL